MGGRYLAGAIACHADRQRSRQQRRRLLRTSTRAYRTEIFSSEAYGWRQVGEADVPDHVSYRGKLATAQEFVQVQDSYAKDWTARDREDLRYTWGRFLFGHEGIAHASYQAEFSHRIFEVYIASRDGGISWSRIGGEQGASSEGTRIRLAADARGYQGLTASSVSGRDVGIGNWSLDPIDPLTIYVT